MTATDLTIVIRSDCVNVTTVPIVSYQREERWLLDVRNTSETPHIALLRCCVMQVTINLMSQFQKEEIHNDNSFCHHLLPSCTEHSESTVWATWIQYHLNPSVLKKMHVSLYFGFGTQTVRRQDTCHSFHCLLSWNVGSLRHHSVSSPEGFLGLLSVTVSAKHIVVVYHGTMLPISPVCYTTNSSAPEAKPGVSSSFWMCELELQLQFIFSIHQFIVRFITYNKKGEKSKYYTITIS